MIALAVHAEGVVLPVVAQPGARRNAILGERAGALRVGISAPPEKGKANVAIQSVLAAAIGCRANQVSLLSGATSRQKRFLIVGIALEALRERLAEVVTLAMSSRSRN
jgi:uncharacterized protein (TIGR00251 family)